MSLHLRTVIAFAIVCASLAQGTAFSADTLDKRIAEQRKQLETLNRRVQYHNRELKEAKQKEKNYLRELYSYDHKVKQSEEQINLLDLQIEKNENELNSVRADIEKRNVRIEELQKILAARCVAIYKYGGKADVDAILNASDLVELSNLTYLMNRLRAEDEKNIQLLDKERKELKSDELRLEQSNEQLTQKFQRRKRERETNRKAAAQRRELLDKIGKEKKLHEQAIREDAEAQREIQKKINDFIRQKALASRGSKKTGPTYKHKGKFDWPVAERRITSNFGMRVHPKFKTKRQHTGIDIGSPRGATIKTAGAGEVIFAGWMRGYGQVVIIDHGSGFATVYAHMSKILVDDGQNVKRGGIIGKVGQTGVATGPHLHFEVRVKGVAQNPLKYL